MQAIIEVSRRGAIFDAVAEQVATARRGGQVDYRLSFESAKSLFSEITPERLEVLDVLRRIGPCRIEALARELSTAREPATVRADIARLEVLGLIERDEDQSISVPFTTIEIILPLAQFA